MKSGFVSIIGRPNTGKSTLLNNILDFKVAITSDKSGTTRNIIQGIYNEDGIQIVFLDTPGIHKPQNKLGKVLNKEAYSLMEDVDVILFLVDGKAGLGKGDKMILESLKNSSCPVILVINKIDLISKEELLFKIKEYSDLYSFNEIVPVSAYTGDNVKTLIDVVKKYLTNNIRYFGDDEITSSPYSFLASEYVREKILQETEEEIPHSITCVTTGYKDEKNLASINVLIIVDRDSLKKIIIGKNGDRLKRIGTLSRKELEKLVGKKVYLELYVKTVKNWRNKMSVLTELGFNELNLK